MLRKTAFALAVLVMVAAAVPLPARQAPASTHASLFSAMRWRNIGPLRAGRTKALAGVPSQPFTFYMGMVNGGVWKTLNAGRTWTPIFDDQPTGSIGSIAVALSDPNIIYVGSGEGLQRPDLAIGDGMYKSTDAGRTWTHLGLRDSQQIARVEVDPQNPNRLFVAVLGHPYGPNEERGIFRSTDGGASFQRVLYKDENVGGKDVDIDPSNPNIVYATLLEGRQGPWENAAWAGKGGVFKSTDGGTTWTELKKGLPDSIGNAELTIAPSEPKRIYAYVTPAPEGGRGGGGRGRGAAAANNPIYRSDDAGESWAAVSNDQRVGTSNETSICVDPKNPDWLIVTSQVTTKSEDGGKTWVPFKGAPGGDDYQYAWINPHNTDIIFAVADQGAVVSLDRGRSWSSWYNQPTAAMYHVTADNAFPYRVCGGQQDSGSACVASRGTDGAITMREWHPASIEEYGYAAPDPLDPDIVYGTKEVTKYDRRTNQVSDVGPLGGRGSADPALSRQVRTQPIVFSMVDKKSLFFSTNVLWKTMDGGVTWKQISPDLTRRTHDIPASVGKYAEQVRTANQADVNGARVIYTIGPSYQDLNRIWVGTDDGVIATTADGGLHWTDVTPKQMGSYWKVFMMEPGRFDPLTAYAAVNTLRIDDQNPHIFRTHDGGRTWTEIVNGIPGGAAVSAIREDVKRKGLLFAGSETNVYVSFDDGDHWESLRLNMAPSSVRDLQVKDDDLIAGTHGRGIWILDDITPLRQIGRATADSDVLFRPQPSLRVRWNTNTDTPLPPDEPRLPNPPEGGIINYYLKADASGPVVLEVFDAGGTLVRRYSSADPITPLPDPKTNAPLPLYWYREPQGLSAKAGMHRFMWDVHYQPLPGGGGGRGGLPIAAVPFNTVPAPGTPWAPPGQYTVKLTANGRTLSQPLTVTQDPRVKTPALVMQQVYTLSTAAYREAERAFAAAGQAQRLRERLAEVQSAASAKTDLASALTAFDKKIEEIAGAAVGGGRGGRGSGGFGSGAAPAGAPTLWAAAAGLGAVMNVLQSADVQPTAVQLKALASARAAGTAAMARWTAIKTVDLPAVNVRLKAAGLPPIEIK
ncbi:MAG: glycoside hydrolase [Vicinamibacterales bacterium]